MSSQELLRVEDLGIAFRGAEGEVRAVDGISFAIARGETLGLVGESGCGKTVTALSLLGLIPKPAGRLASGRMMFEGQDLANVSEKAWRHIRGSRIAMIFQEPMTALNPVLSIGQQLADVLCRHKGMRRSAALAEAANLLATVGIPDPKQRLKEYPHQLSGGMRQRVMIAMAFSCQPALLIADEPTTALDVTTQAQVMEELMTLSERAGMATMLVTHDMGLVAEYCQRVIVMYCGKIVEMAPSAILFTTPRHHYTKGLLQAIPTIRPQTLDRLPAIPGTVPSLADLPKGCRFVDRCPRAAELCHREEPILHPMGVENHWAACHFPAT